MSSDRVEIEINSRTFEYDRTYPYAIRSFITQSKWEEFCRKVDQCIKDAKKLPCSPILFLILFIACCIGFTVFCVAFSSDGLFGGLFSGGMALCAFAALVCVCRCSRSLDISPAIALLEKENTERTFFIWAEKPEHRGDPYKIIIKPRVHHATPEPIIRTVDGKSEETPLLSDATPGNSEVISGLPTYYDI